MKLCVLTTSFPRSPADDAGIFVAHLIRNLGKQGAEGDIIVPHDQLEPLTETFDTFQIKRFKYGFFRRGRVAFGAGIGSNLKADPTLFLQVPNLLRGFYRTALRDGFNAELIQANWLGTALPAQWLHRHTGKPYVITLRGEDVRLVRKKHYRALLASALKNAAAIVSVNQTFAEEVSELVKFPKERITFIPNGVEVSPPSPLRYDFFLRDRNFDPTKSYLLFVGTLIPRKRIELLIQLLKEDGLKHYTLILCGRQDNQAYLRKLQNLSTELKVSDRIRFEGLVPPVDVPCYLKLASYYVTASEFEGRSNSLLEAMAAGLISFASDIPAHRELVSHEKNGFLVNFENSASLAQTLNTVAGDDHKKADLKQNAVALAARFSWSETAARYLELFKRITGPTR